VFEWVLVRGLVWLSFVNDTDWGYNFLFALRDVLMICILFCTYG
jgi:hypothetical protein